MYVGWLFDSNQNVTGTADCKFNSTQVSNTITVSSSTLSRKQNHKHHFLGNWIFGITTKKENKSEINVIQQNQEPSPQNTTGRNKKTLKILLIICILLEPSIRRNWNVQTEMNAMKHEEATACSRHC
jgi:hypothetical protein